MLKCALVGFGYWGPNLLRNLILSPEFDLKLVVDKSLDQISKVREILPDISVSTELESICSKEIQVVFIATPPETHFEISELALSSGKHVWCEKPFTTRFEDAIYLSYLAKKNELKLWVDLPYLFHPAIMKLHDDYQKGDFGNLLYYISTRGNFGMFHQSVSVISDLVVHDLGIIQQFFREMPKSVKASSHHELNSEAKALTFCSLEWPTGFIAHIVANQLSPVKIRSLLLGGEYLSANFDDNTLSEKLIYSCNELQFSELIKNPAINSEYKLGKTWSPRLSNTEALKTALTSFHKLISNPEEPQKFDVLKTSLYSHILIQSLEKSAKNNGACIEIPKTLWDKISND